MKYCVSSYYVIGYGDSLAVFGHSCNTVSKAVNNPIPPGYRLAQPRSKPAIESFAHILDEWIEQNKNTRRKQRMYVTKMYERLCDEYSFTGHYSTVQRYVKEATKGIGGILPDPENYGMKSFVIKPSLLGDLTYANTTSGSYYGSIVSNWSRSAATGKFHIEVPVNTTAKVYIPAKDVRDVTESGKPAAKANGVTLIGKDGDSVVFLINSGEYDFTSLSVPPAK
ncbi:MAG: Bacterial alpha-L-rhamnosidase [Planctomycetes bacterium]|nr:Bacterial alpha-L-rhamnosidase [Planctomycetota bacterium]